VKESNKEFFIGIIVWLVYMVSLFPYLGIKGATVSTMFTMIFMTARRQYIKSISNKNKEAKILKLEKEINISNLENKEKSNEINNLRLQLLEERLAYKEDFEDKLDTRIEEVENNVIDFLQRKQNER
jgi:hypothetical protein